jgi:hypothetical protein
VQCLEECNKRRRLRGTQVLPICRHVAASLDYLANKLVLRQPNSNAVQCRPSLPARFPEGMTVAALLDLKNERALPFKRRRPVQ